MISLTKYRPTYYDTTHNLELAELSQEEKDTAYKQGIDSARASFADAPIDSFLDFPVQHSENLAIWRCGYLQSIQPTDDYLLTYTLALAWAESYRAELIALLDKYSDVCRETEV